MSEASMLILVAVTTGFVIAIGTIVATRRLFLLEAKRQSDLLEDAVLARVDEILDRVDGGIELEIVRYAA